MKVTLAMVGKTRDDYIRSGVSVYQKRLKRYVTFIYNEIPDLKKKAGGSQSEWIRMEGEAILEQARDSDFLVILDEKGREFSSVELADSINDRMIHSTRHICFVIGGAYGISPEVKAKANLVMSLSRMTFSHQLVRLLFMEQLYRAFTIIKGEPYHHN